MDFIQPNLCSNERPLAAAVLAGGQSKRMGRDKAWLNLEGEPLWKRQLIKLKAAGFDPLIVSCREEQGIAEALTAWDQDRCAAGDFAFDVKVILDPVTMNQNGIAQGPLAAVVRCLEQVNGPLLVCAVDLPQLTVELLSQLRKHASQMTGGMLVKHGEQVEPLLSVWHPQSLPALIQAMKQQPKQPSLKQLLAQEEQAGRATSWQVPKDPEHGLTNWNHPTDLPPSVNLIS
jgi:molybdopterin-guanine dinucleotide biosynthesis protein A